MQSSRELLKELHSILEKKGIIDDEFAKYLESIFPDKSPDILEVVKRGSTKYIFKPSNRIMWSVIGENDEYIIYPKTYCSCIDFYNSVILKRKRPICKHLVAQTICEALGNIKEEEMMDSDFKLLIEEIKLDEKDFGII